MNTQPHQVAGVLPESRTMTDRNGKPCAPSFGLPARHVWEIQRLKDRGPGNHYRYAIEGINHHNGSAFSWSVPDVSGDQYSFAEGVIRP